ncbi:MAG: hypothetical protein II796_01435 [Oscillospiraceae bacterium]|nr:hypothetical protein [Oscillospiraceae bacterium]
MKKVVSCILAILSFMLVANGQVAAEGKDEMITKDYSITLPASCDCKIVVKVTAQYMYNEARKMCKCLDITYDIIESNPHYKINVDLCRNNLTSDRGGARIYDTHCPTGKIDKLIIFMNFDHTGTAEHKITVG